MKTFAIILAALAASVVAQNESPTPTGTGNTPASTEGSYSEETKECLSGCPTGDVKCQAACLNNPFPTEEDANRTTECAEECDQGDGSPDDTERFAQCVQGCISSFFPMQSGGPGGASPTGGENTPAPEPTPVTTTDESGSTCKLPIQFAKVQQC